ncbi:MAG: ATP-binding protein [Bacteroidetes bacterium]|nr:ATP-binding protein [Bacteroidota bacterium]
MIKRIHEQGLLESLRFQPATVILGPRQVGKTTLAKTIAKKLKKKCLYLDLENPTDITKMSDGFSYLEPHSDKCVIIDEVQQLPALFTWLRPLIDMKRKPGRFLLLGSANPALVRGVSESLAGRVAYHELPPVTLQEALRHKIPMARHWFRGGFPRSLTAKNDSEYGRWAGDFINSYVERDLSHFFGIDFTPVQLRNFWSMIAHAHGSIWNASSFGRAMGISNHTATRYLDYLEGAYLVRRLPAWFVNAKKRLVKAPKIYIRDTGLLHRLCNIQNFDALQGYTHVGASWEGYVIEQVLQSIPDTLRAFYYRTHQDAECDLVLVKGITPMACIEIKRSNAPQISKGFYSCVNDLKTTNNFIIIPDGDTYTKTGNITVCALNDFINTQLPKINKSKR